MWILVDTEEKERILLPGRTYIVGRNEQADIQVADQSLSRKHATLQVAAAEAPSQRKTNMPIVIPILSINDTSKFGTFIGNNSERRLTNGEKYSVQTKTMIKFGTGNSVYCAYYKPFIVTTSCVETPKKKEIKAMIARLQGQVVSDWRKDVQILIMDRINVTIKVICALIAQKPIVTANYLSEWIKAIESGNELPKSDAYLPEVSETQLDQEKVSFGAEKLRKTLFKGMDFIFLSAKQFHKLSIAVELAGGVPTLMEEGNDDNDDSIFYKKTTVVMQATDALSLSQATQNGQEWIRHVEQVLSKHGLRSIPDSELGYAVLYCSTESYCNPFISASVAVPSSGQIAAPASQSLSARPEPDIDSASEVSAANQPEPAKKFVVPSTPSQAQKPSSSVRTPSGPSVIDESFNGSGIPSSATRASKPNETRGSKRPRSDDEEIEPPSKTTKTEPQIEIKKEPISQPEKSQPKRAEEAPQPQPGPSTSRAGLSNIQREPPVPFKREKRSHVQNNIKHEVLDDDETGHRDEFDEIPTKKSQNAGAKTKKKTIDEMFDDFDDIPSSKSQNTGAKSKKKTVDDLFDEFDDMPSAKPAKNPAKASKPSGGGDPFDAFDAIPDPVPKRKQQTQCNAGDDIDEFDAIPSAKPPKNNRQQTQRNAGDDIDEFDAIPSAKPPKNNRQQTKSNADDAVDEFDAIPSAKPPKNNRQQTKSNADDAVDEFDAIPSAKPPKNNKNHERPAENQAPQRPKDGQSRPQSVPKPHTNGDVKPPPTVNGCTGVFLNCDMYDQEGASPPRRNLEENYDPELPRCDIVADVCSLMVRQPGYKAREIATDAGGGYVMWRGKRVKNVKKFKKNVNAGANELPRIIGGTDLIVHDNKSNKELEEWLKEHTDSQYAENNTEENLFDFEIKNPSTNGTASLKRKR